MFENKSPNEKTEILIKNTNNLIDSLINTKTKKKKNQTPNKPWITQGLLKSICTKNKLFKKYMNTKSEKLRFDRHNKIRHYVNYKTLLSIYYAIFESHIGYIIQTWGFIKADLFNKISSLQRRALRYMHLKKKN